MRVTHTLCALGLLTVAVGCGTSKSSDNQPAPAATTPEQQQQLNADYSQLPQNAIVRVPVDASGNATGEPEMHTYSGSASLTDVNTMSSAFDSGSDAAVAASTDELDKDTSSQSWTSWNNYGNGSNGYGSTGYGSSGYGTSGYGTTPVTTYGGNTYGGTTYGGTTYGGTTPVTTYGGTTYGGTTYGGVTPVTTYGNPYGGSAVNYGSGYGGYTSNFWSTVYKPVLYWHGTGWNYGDSQPTSYGGGGYNYYCYDRPAKYW